MLKKTVLVVSLFMVLGFSCDITQLLDDEGKFSVEYNGNNNTGGTVPRDDKEYEKGDTVTVLANSGNLERFGFTFAGWNASHDGSGTHYAPSSTFDMGDDDMVLYAQWAAEGTLTVNINNAATFNNHTLYYTIYDSNATDGGQPSGNVLAKCKIPIVNNQGSAVTTVSTTDTSEKVFDNGTYYLGGMVDMNDDATAPDYTPNTGDRYSDLIEVAIIGNSTKTLQESQFSHTY